MPSDKKRVNLTIPDDVYSRLQAYKQRMGISNDATACFQLIVQQLKSQEDGETILKVLRECSLEQLLQQSKEGLTILKSQLPPAGENEPSGGGL